MKDQELLERITLNTKRMAGKLIIQGIRLTVEYVLNLLAHGATTEEILAEYQGLKPEDIPSLSAYRSVVQCRRSFGESRCATAYRI